MKKMNRWCWVSTTWLSLRNGVINFSQAWDKEKNLSSQQKLNLPCGRKFLQVLIFAIFAVFLAICKHKFPRIKITANFFSRKNLLQSKFSLTYIGYTKIQYWEIVSVQSQVVSFIQKQRKTGLLFEKIYLCFNLPTKWQTLLRMKYVLCSVRKGNTNNMMEKKWQCEILHIAGLLNSENPIQIQLKHSRNMYCRRRWGQLTAWKIQTIEQGRGRNGEEEGWGKIFVCQRDQERDILYTTINKYDIT